MKERPFWSSMFRPSSLSLILRSGGLIARGPVFSRFDGGGACPRLGPKNATGRWFVT